MEDQATNTAEKETVVVTDRGDNGSNAGVIIAVLLVVIVLVALFMGNPFSGSSDSTNIEVQSPAPSSATE